MTSHTPSVARRIAGVLAALILMAGMTVLPASANTAKVTAASAGTKTVGQTTYVWGSFSGLKSPARVQTQVLINGTWSTSQVTSSTGSYTLPLTYGANTVGTTTWRVVASDGYTRATSPTFTLTRTAAPKVTATSAGTKTVGQTTYVWGSFSGLKSPARVQTQVLINGTWSTSQVTSSTGSYTLPLTYGANTVGTTTWRVVASDGYTRATSPTFTLTRTAATTGGIPNSTWYALAECESGNNPTIVSSNGLYYGLYQFRLDTWRSVGGTGLPTQHSREEQTYRASILQARSGWGQWPACSRMLGLR